MALVVLCVGMLMIILDSTVVNVALPAIQDDLGFSQSSLAWVINAYLIAFGGLLLLVGRLGDLVGRRRIFLAGLVVFTLASLLCGAAQSQVMLVVARLIQGVGGAMTSAVILGMIVTMFPSARDRAKAIGVFSFVASAGGSIGLLAGGVITDLVSWHWIFLINVPIGIATAALALRVVPDQRGLGLAGGADAFGATLITGALMLGVYTIVKVTDYGWASLHTLGLGGVALALLAGFVVRQQRAAHPLVPLRIFRSRNVSGANAVQLLMVAGLFGMFFLGTLYLQRVLGMDAIEIGLAFLPLSLAIGTLSLGFSERLNMRFGPRATLVPALVSIVAALALFARVPVDGSYFADVLPSMLLLGIGAGLAFPSLMTLAMSDATPEDSGLASGLVNTSQQVGGALGLSVLATLSATRTESLLSAGDSTSAALTGGYHLAFAIAAGLVAVGLVIAVTVLRAVAPAREPAEAEAETAIAMSEAA
ncbi:putative MFS-type transporter EfpA [Capillimicrobium parvum]|uniref:MFS-type transporter EfpA n=1 Tax=Capillimicrobium parvum TaxID=2884022 RepID=A0A9E6Y063_9ACTN|nr:putative MFS-type transporter EfpA [Capillimicrobium parvum]